MTAHQTEREREQGVYGYARPRLGFRCVKCGQWWTKAPRSRCPGVTAYWEWDKAQAAGLRTMTQWRTERRKLIPNATPTGAMMRDEWYWLYPENQTTPMRAAPRKREREESDDA